MHSPLDRTAAAVTPLRHHGVLVRLLGLGLLGAVCVCTSLGGAAAANGPPAGASTALAGEATSAHVDFAMAERGEGRGDELASHRGDEGALVAPEVTESEEEIGEVPAPRGPGRIDSTSEVQARCHRDPIVGLCCVLVAPPRAPPLVVSTAD